MKKTVLTLFSLTALIGLMSLTNAEAVSENSETVQSTCQCINPNTGVKTLNVAPTYYRGVFLGCWSACNQGPIGPG